MAICRAPPTAPLDLLCGSSSQRTGVSLTKDSTQTTEPLRVRNSSILTLSLHDIRYCFSPAVGVIFLFVHSIHSFLYVVILKTFEPLLINQSILTHTLTNFFVPFFTHSATSPFNSLTHRFTCTHIPILFDPVIVLYLFGSVMHIVYRTGTVPSLAQLLGQIKLFVVCM